MKVSHIILYHHLRGSSLRLHQSFVSTFRASSGWFGITLKKKSVANLLFQSLFVSVVVSLLCFGYNKLFVSDLPCVSIAQLIKSSIHWNWFILSYLLLMVLSPIINKYVEYSNKKDFEKLLLVFFGLQTILDLSGLVDFYDKGYLPVYLLGIYLLGRYIKVHRPNFAKFTKVKDGAIYLVMITLLALLSTLLINLRTGITGYAYTNPLIIVASVHFFLLFTKLSIKGNKVINLLATSSLSVFLVHTNELLMPSFRTANWTIYKAFDRAMVPVIMIMFLIVMYLISVIIDQIRIVCWKIIYKYI